MAKTTHAPLQTTAPTASAAGAMPGARAVLGMEDLAPSLTDILAHAIELKAQAKTGALPQLLAGKAILMIYEKNSTRTRVSFEVGVARLGGIAVNLDAQVSQLSRGESIEDTAQVLSRYGHALVYRANRHDSLEALARYATVPVVNALTDREHPCQVLADLMVMKETWGGLNRKTLAYVGDGNNMCHSYLLGAPLVGMDVQVATPKGYAPDPEVVARARQLAEAAGTKVTVTTDMAKALRGAEAVATDTWVSMGDEAETLQRRKAFEGWTLTEELLAAHAAPGCLFLHCLPGHWGEEATYDLAHGPRSLIYDEAEDRMWVQMALLVHLLGKPETKGEW
ncbi:MAG: ornithine carbamoyltransferase [Halobacteriales archaeon]|nr:ornithine carbamoyltransferase [Halobacteriales archaeon]